DFFFEAFPKDARFQRDVTRRRWSCRHKFRAMGLVQILRAVVLCHATVSRASVAKQISIVIRCVWIGLCSASSCARQSFLRRYNLVYECILELFSNPTRLELGTER